MRYLSLTEDNRKEMLKAIGIGSVDEIYKRNVANDTLLGKKFDLPDHQGEIEVENFFNDLAKKNLSADKAPFFLGAGCYNHHIPASVDHIVQRSEFLTAYTPYQPEISQGTLQVIFEFQSIIARLTGMEVANASMYDGATATAEAALMAMRIARGKKNKVNVVKNLHPEYDAVLKNYVEDHAGGVVESGIDNVDENTACIVVQTPDFCGNVNQGRLAQLRQKCDEAGAMLIVVVTEIVSLGLLEAPREADIVVGEASSLGVTMNFGGPHLGFFACKKQYIRQMPGRICGATKDEDGKQGFVLTLNAREQHIRRDKATSNICSNQGLCATAFTIHSAMLGENGLKQLALLNHEKACQFVDMLGGVTGVEVENNTFFNEFTIKLPCDSQNVVKELVNHNIICGLALENNRLLVAVTELTSNDDMQNMKEALVKVISK